MAGISNAEKRKSILEKHKKLEDTVLEFPLMFHKSFKAGMLKIPPVKFEFNKDINKVEPIVSKLKPLAYSERVALKEWWIRQRVRVRLKSRTARGDQQYFQLRNLKLK